MFFKINSNQNFKLIVSLHFPARLVVLMTVGDDNMSVLLFVFQLRFKCGYQCSIRRRRARCCRVHSLPPEQLNSEGKQASAGGWVLHELWHFVVLFLSNHRHFCIEGLNNLYVKEWRGCSFCLIMDVPGDSEENQMEIIFMVEPCILRSIDCLLPTNALNVNFT
jgi:hypothetical protein